MEDTLEVIRVVEAQPRKARRRRPRPKTKRQPPYSVVLHNDEVNGFEFVVSSLQRVFGYATTKAYRLTLEAHVAGRSMVWSGAREHAELKAEQLASCGPDPEARGALPLRVTVEPQA